MRTPLVAGNWKMNGSCAMAAGLMTDVHAGLAGISGVDVVICPPFVLVPQCSQAADGTSIAVGGQNLDTHEPGAFTGEIAAEMLMDAGCEFVIVGHSERRALYGETDELVAHKTRVAFTKGLTPIICVGETLEEREEGATEEVVTRQLMAVLNEAGSEIFPRAIVAYEPVWAIGTGRTATDAQAQDVHALVRQRLAAANSTAAESTRILYGGSVKPENAAGLFSQPDIDGGLIGGASLKAEDFLGIIRAANS